MPHHRSPALFSWAPIPTNIRLLIQSIVLYRTCILHLGPCMQWCSWVFIDGMGLLNKRHIHQYYSQVAKGWFHYISCGSCIGACGLHTTIAELDQSSISAIVTTRVGTDYIALIMITILMTQKYVINYNQYNGSITHCMSLNT